jgi:hypothetical protein
MTTSWHEVQAVANTCFQWSWRESGGVAALDGVLQVSAPFGAGLGLVLESVHGSLVGLAFSQLLPSSD